MRELTDRLKEQKYVDKLGHSLESNVIFKILESILESIAEGIDCMVVDTDSCARCDVIVKCYDVNPEFDVMLCKYEKLLEKENIHKE